MSNDLKKRDRDEIVAALKRKIEILQDAVDFIVDEGNSGVSVVGKLLLVQQELENDK